MGSYVRNTDIGVSVIIPHGGSFGSWFPGFFESRIAHQNLKLQIGFYDSL